MPIDEREQCDPMMQQKVAQFFPNISQRVAKSFYMKFVLLKIALKFTRIFGLLL